MQLMAGMADLARRDGDKRSPLIVFLGRASPSRLLRDGCRHSQLRTRKNCLHCGTCTAEKYLEQGRTESCESGKEINCPPLRSKGLTSPRLRCTNWRQRPKVSIYSAPAGLSLECRFCSAPKPFS